MQELTKIKKNIEDLINKIQCLFSVAPSATRWTVNHSSATGNKYRKDTLVWHNNFIYKCLVDNNGSDINNPYFWKKINPGWLLDQEQADWLSTGGESFIRNKPTKLSDFENDVIVTTENQNNTYREVYLGSYDVNQGKEALNALFNQSLTVSQIENIMLVFSSYDSNDFVGESTPIIYRYKWAKGRGTWNPIPNIVGQDILFESVSGISSEDITIIINGANTQTYSLGDINGETLVDTINSSGPYDLTDNTQTYLFLYEDDEIVYLYQFIGVNGNYGDTATPITASDLLFITSSETTVDTLQNVFSEVKAQDNSSIFAISPNSNFKISGTGGIETYTFGRTLFVDGSNLQPDIPSLQDVINVDKNADRVRFYKDVFAKTNWTVFNYLIQVAPSTIDDKFYVYGEFTFGGVGNDIARFNADGTYDTTFNVGAGFNRAPFASFESFDDFSDGSLFVSGDFTSYNEIAASRIIKLNNNGTIDTSFDYGTGFNRYTTGLALDSNNKLYIGGDFATYKSVASNRIIRLDLDGSKDTSFNIGTGFNGAVIDVKVDSSDKIYVTGYFTSYNGTAAKGIIRLNNNGSVDTLFVYGTGITQRAGTQNFNQIIFLSDGKLLVYGNIESYNGTPANGAIKLNTDGTVDATFLANIGTGFQLPTPALTGTIYVVYAKETSYGTILFSAGFVGFNGVETNNSIELNLDGTVYKYFPNSTLDGAYLINNDVMVGLTLEGGVYSLALVEDYYPVNTKELTFSEVTGKAEYKIGGLDTTSEEELLPKRLIQELITEATSTIESAIPWTTITSNQTLELNKYYLTNNATKLVLTLPEDNENKTIKIASKLGGWQLLIPAGWEVLIADEIVTQDLESTLVTDSIELLSLGNNKYSVIELKGNIIFNNL
jgi:uncharacterized delta-60 repeat protein